MAAGEAAGEAEAFGEGLAEPAGPDGEGVAPSVMWRLRKVCSALVNSAAWSLYLAAVVSKVTSSSLAPLNR